VDPAISGYLAPQLFIHIPRILFFPDFERQGDTNKDIVLRWRVDADRNAYIIVPHHPIIFISNLATICLEMKGHGRFDVRFEGNKSCFEISQLLRIVQHVENIVVMFEGFIQGNIPL
jgi:hypothetical protein